MRSRVLLLEAIQGIMFNGQAVMIASQLKDRLHVKEAHGLGHLAAHTLD